MANSFSISKAYWDKLSDKEKFFMQVNAMQRGVVYCKRILTLANIFPVWDDIVSANVYVHDIPCENQWVVFCKGKMIGLIYKSLMGFGITEKISVSSEKGFREIWNNWKTNNPNSSEKSEIVKSVMARIA